MKSVIVGTAGHIDHGKTALVKALTGIDADRLEEEKRRGITIDIGFAHLALPSPNGEALRLGFVDVPGHERFVRNMLAGIGGIDLVLLVIAADESIKPQTREHFDICRLLSVRRGITVLTKCDMVDRDTLDVVRLEVADFVRGSFLDTSQAPIVAVSSLTGEGMDELKRTLARIAAETSARDSSNFPRLPIDRVFTMKGFGTVVTGTLISGVINKDDDLEVFPRQQRVRVRGVQVHSEAATQASAGERTALNLAGATVDELSRGMTLAPPATFRSTSRVDVELTLLASAKPLKDRARVHLHAYTSETIATVVLHNKKQIKPGETGFAQLRLAEPTLLLPGDRFILRQFSPVITIGGGAVLDASPMSKIKPEALEKFLTICKAGSVEQILLARIARRGFRGLPVDQIVAETGLTQPAIATALSKFLSEKVVIRAGDRFVDAAAFSGFLSRLFVTVSEFQKREPLAPGINKETLREGLEAPPDLFGVALEASVRSKNLDLVGDLVRLPGRGVVMKDDEAESRNAIESAFSSAGLKVPALKDVLASLKLDKVRAQKIVTLLLRDKVLIKISEDLVFHRDALAALRKQIAGEKTKSPKIDVARFKDMLGVTRKYAIPLLEYLDREHVTRRVGDERIIL